MSAAGIMRSHSPGSYSLSLVLHGAAVLAILISARIFNDARKTPGTQIIELVAGPGDNYMATEAPALGAPGSTTMPEVAFTPPAGQPRPAPVAPPPEPVVTPAENPGAPADNALAVPPAKRPPPPKTIPKPEAPRTMSKADFDKLNAGKNKNPPSSKTPPASKTAVIVPPKIGQGIVDGVSGGAGSAAGAGGTALTAAERDQMDAYFALLAQRIREAQEKPEGLGSELVVRIEFQVSASGIIGAVKIIRSSGNRAFDDSVLKAIRAVRPIGRRPDGKSGAKVADFRMREE